MSTPTANSANEVRAHCDSIGYDTLEAFTTTCWYYTSLKLVSYAIIIAACLIKVP